jgi:hypothetical protein
VTKETEPARPYVIVPSSTNEPSPKRSTRDSRTAWSPAIACTRERIPAASSTVVSV